MNEQNVNVTEVAEKVSAKERVLQWKQEHPRITKGVKIAGAAVTIVGAFFLGDAYGKKNSKYSEIVDTEYGDDPAPVEEEE